MAKAPSLPAALEQLYAAPPGEFTSLRAGLVKALKDARRVDDARKISQRRKPTQAAYLLNQLARRHADEVAELVDTGRALERGQRAALRGHSSDDLRGAMQRQRTIMRALVRRSLELGEALSVAVSTHAVSEAFQCVLGDPQRAAALEAGLLETAPAGGDVDASESPFSLEAEAEADAPSEVVSKKEKQVVEPASPASSRKRAADHAKPPKHVTRAAAKKAARDEQAAIRAREAVATARAREAAETARVREAAAKARKQRAAEAARAQAAKRAAAEKAKRRAEAKRERVATRRRALDEARREQTKLVRERGALDRSIDALARTIARLEAA